MCRRSQKVPVDSLWESLLEWRLSCPGVGHQPGQVHGCASYTFDNSRTKSAPKPCI